MIRQILKYSFVLALPFMFHATNKKKQKINKPLRRFFSAIALLTKGHRLSQLYIRRKSEIHAISHNPNEPDGKS